MKYHKREITYDEKTENFKITCPELGLEVLGDTEMGALLEMRKEVVAAAKRPKTQTIPSITQGKLGFVGAFDNVSKRLFKTLTAEA